MAQDEIDYLADRVYYGCYMGNQFFTQADLFKKPQPILELRSTCYFTINLCTVNMRLVLPPVCRKDHENMHGETRTKATEAHKLAHLFDMIGGVQVEARLLDDIQCSAEVRYNSSLSTEVECVRAHEAAQKVAAAVLSIIRAMQETPPDPVGLPLE